MSALPGTRPTGPAIKAAEVAGGPEVSAAASVADSQRKAAKATGGKATGGKAAGGRRQITPGMSPDEVNGELQRRRAAAAQPSASSPAPADDPPAPADPATAAPAAPAPSSSGTGLSIPALTGTGGGFLLGIFGWALGLAYLRGGAPEVRKLLAAKFLNKTN